MRIKLLHFTFSVLRFRDQIDISGSSPPRERTVSAEGDNFREVEMALRLGTSRKFESGATSGKLESFRISELPGSSSLRDFSTFRSLHCAASRSSLMRIRISQIALPAPRSSATLADHEAEFLPFFRRAARDLRTPLIYLLCARERRRRRIRFDGAARRCVYRRRRKPDRSGRVPER